ELSRGKNGLWKPLTINLAAFARNVRGYPSISGSRVEATLVLGAQHGHFIREARDQANQRIFATSQRFGSSAKQSVIIPAMAAAKARASVETQVFFGRPSGQMSGKEAAELTQESGKHGVKIRSVYDPRLHAKILAWDDESVVVTSQNWLSADPGHNSPFQEVGVYLKGTRLADNIVQTFLNARKY
ncbi:MAG: phospholipase D-like domain-containing protein, partial [Coleofasciculus sp. C2-GNP5-27]